MIEHCRRHRDEELQNIFSHQTSGICKERPGCFTLIELMLLCSESLSHCALGWSTVCDCVISQSYLHFCIINVNMYKNNVPNPSKNVAKIRNRYNQVPHLNQDTTLESDKNIIKHNKKEQKGQPFPSR